MKERLIVKDFYFSPVDKSIDRDLPDGRAYFYYRKEDLVDMYINGRNFLEILREIDIKNPEKCLEPQEDELDYLYYSYIPTESYYYYNALRKVCPDTIVTDVTPYICHCGDPCCWSFRHKIFFGKNQVIWFDFENPHRPECYKSLPRFVFDYDTYNRGLESLKQFLYDKNRILTCEDYRDRRIKDIKSILSPPEGHYELRFEDYLENLKNQPNLENLKEVEFRLFSYLGYLLKFYNFWETKDRENIYYARIYKIITLQQSKELYWIIEQTKNTDNIHLSTQLIDKVIYYAKLFRHKLENIIESYKL